MRTAWVIIGGVAVVLIAFLISNVTNRQPTLTGPGGFKVPPGFTVENESMMENYIVVTYSGSGVLGNALDSFSNAIQKENWTVIGEGSLMRFYGRMFGKDNNVILISGHPEDDRILIYVIAGPKPAEEENIAENEQPVKENEQPLTIRSISFTMKIENCDISEMTFYARNLENIWNAEIRIDAVENGLSISYIMSWRTGSGWARSENENWISFEEAGIDFDEFSRLHLLFLNYAGALGRVSPEQEVKANINNLSVTFSNILLNPLLPDVLFQPI